MSKIIGIDILAGASSQKLSSVSVNRFAVVLMNDGKIIESFNSLSPKKLILLCKQQEPELLGVDNIFELESNSAKIIDFCAQLPIETKIIQVTGAPPDGFEPLNRLAKRHNIPYPFPHATPVQTAEIICKLAEKGVGYILRPFEDETEIKVSRSRAIGPGGWSQQRYSRKMRGEVLTLTREIEKQLLDHKIDYDIEVRKTEYGYDNAVFRTYTTLAVLRKIVKPFRGELARVIITPIRKKRLEFIPATSSKAENRFDSLRKSDRGLIVGIDPGPNKGIAVLNFAGKILMLNTIRNMARGDIVREITSLGDPSLIAADVTPPPDFVVKMAKMLNAILYFPERLFSSDEKNSFIDEYILGNEFKISGTHKKDALFAAIKAYNKYKGLFEKIDNELSKPDDIQLRNKVKQLVLRDEMNIQEAIENVRKQEKVLEKEEIKEEEEVILTEKEKTLIEKIDSLKELINRQTVQIENLDIMNEEAEEEINKIRFENKLLRNRISNVLRTQTQELKRERTIKTKDDELRFLRGKVTVLDEELTRVKGIISDLKRMIVMGSSKIVVPMKVVFEFTREGIEKTVERMNIESFDVVLLVDSSGGGRRTAEMLIEREVKAIVCAKENISNTAMEAFLEANVPVLFYLPIRQIDDIAVTYYDELEQAIKDWQIQREKILGSKTEEKLSTLIAQYQDQRKKELTQLYQSERKKKDLVEPKKPIKTIETKDIDEK